MVDEKDVIELVAEPVDANPAALVPLVPPTTSVSPVMSMSDIINLGNVLVRSGMFRSTTNAEQAVAKILAGREYGLGPIQSMSHIYVIDGKVGMSAALIGAKIRQHPAYNFKVTGHDKMQCAIEFYYQGEIAGTSTFTIEDAKDAGLIRKGGPWEKYPRNMVYARALTNGARWYCPDVFGGAVYTPDELGAGVVFDSTGQEVFEAKAISAPPASAPPRASRRETTGDICPKHGTPFYPPSAKQIAAGFSSPSHKVADGDGFCSRDDLSGASFEEPNSDGEVEEQAW